MRLTRRRRLGSDSARRRWRPTCLPAGLPYGTRADALEHKLLPLPHRVARCVHDVESHLQRTSIRRQLRLETERSLTRFDDPIRGRLLGLALDRELAVRSRQRSLEGAVGTELQSDGHAVLLVSEGAVEPLRPCHLTCEKKCEQPCPDHDGLLSP